MSDTKHTPGSIAALAESARMMPWDKSITDVPYSVRSAFQRAITADHYMALLEALTEARDYIQVNCDCLRDSHTVPGTGRLKPADVLDDDLALLARIDAAIAAATAPEQAR